LSAAGLQNQLMHNTKNMSLVNNLFLEISRNKGVMQTANNTKKVGVIFHYGCRKPDGRNSLV